MVNVGISICKIDTFYSLVKLKKWHQYFVYILHRNSPQPFWSSEFTVVRSKNWPPQISLKLKFYYINQVPWTWIWKNYINISHRKKVYLVTRPTFSDFSKFWPRLLNKLFSYGRYWYNSFRFMFRALDLYKKISISMKSEVVNFSALLLWNLNFKMVVVSFCARYRQNIGAIF